MLSLSDRRSISRQCGAGIPAEQIAKDYGITAAHVLRIDMSTGSCATPTKASAKPSKTKQTPWKPVGWEGTQMRDTRLWKAVRRLMSEIWKAVTDRQNKGT